MSVKRKIFGVLASVFVLAHLAEMPRTIEHIAQLPGSLQVSAWIGKGLALFIGAGVAIVCFRGKKEEDAEQPAV